MKLTCGLALLLGVTAGACSLPPDRAARLADAGPGDASARDAAPVADATVADGGRAPIGASCSGEQACRRPLQCNTELPGGMCTSNCQADLDCGDPRRWGCLDGLCRPTCSIRAAYNSCRAGYVCRAHGKRGLCVAHCRTATCAQHQSCDEQSGLCLDPQGGTLGAACGQQAGGCEGTPNGICFTLGAFMSAFCTMPCAPFTRPCPQGHGAACLFGDESAAYCAFVCDLQAPSCPREDMKCAAVDDDLAICLPSGQ